MVPWPSFGQLSAPQASIPLFSVTPPAKPDILTSVGITSDSVLPNTFSMVMGITLRSFIQKHSWNWATVHVHSDVEGFEVLGHFLTCFSNKILLDFTGSGSFSGCCSTVWVPWCALPGLAPVSTGSAAAYCACCSTSSVLAWKRKGNPKKEWEQNMEKNQNLAPHLHNPDLHHRNHRSGHCPAQVGIQLEAHHHLKIISSPNGSCKTSLGLRSIGREKTSVLCAASWAVPDAGLQQW